MEQLNIVFCVSNNYIPFIQVTILSIIKNNLNYKINIHIIFDNISKKNKLILLENFNCFNNINFYFYKIDDSRLRGLKNSNWTKYAWYRILIPDIISKKINKILYLDADTLVVEDLSTIYNIPLENHSIAGVLDGETFNTETFNRLKFTYNQRYICSGIMLINLYFWRKNNITEKIIKWAKKNNSILKFPDQDSINYICRDSKFILPLKYGILNYFITKDEFSKFFPLQVKECLNNPIIIHYGDCYPWYKDYKKHYYHNLWLHYNNNLHRPVKLLYKNNIFKRIICIFYNKIQFFKTMIDGKKDK